MSANLSTEDIDNILKIFKRRKVFWELMIGTVQASPDLNSSPIVSVLLDGDKTPINAQMIAFGGDGSSGSRVYVAFVPPTGYFIVGKANGATSQVDTFTASDTWTKPIGAARVKVELIGGGGGGAGAAAAAAGQHSMGAGGGGGTYTCITYDASAVSNSAAIVIGAGGTGGVGALSGATGGTTDFDSAFQVANGGGGGAARGAEATSFGCLGGFGAFTPGTFDLQIPGQTGESPWGDATLCISGGGGNSYMGRGGQGFASGAAGASNAGRDGSGYGAGGGGAQVNAGGSQVNGGNGASGVAIITTYF